MKRTALITSTLLAVAVGSTLSAAPALAHSDHGRPTTYLLTGDTDSPVGSKFEGIGADERRGRVLRQRGDRR